MVLSLSKLRTSILVCGRSGGLTWRLGGRLEAAGDEIITTSSTLRLSPQSAAAAGDNTSSE